MPVNLLLNTITMIDISDKLRICFLCNAVRLCCDFWNLRSSGGKIITEVGSNVNIFSGIIMD
jgi:hypothetical protein